ncbi:ATP-binding protein [Parvularcula marina]|uniref:ATP-binding protein n=1 Tax=Parvularcula marina TaxID=2292771 RepID=UPI0035160B3E
MLKRFAPKSLFGRTILIVVLPIFLMQSIVTWVFFNRHWEEVTATLAKSTASDVGFLTEQWLERGSQDEQVSLLTKAREDLEITMTYVPTASIPEEDQRSFFNALNRVLDRELDWSLDRPYWYNTTGFDNEVEIRVQLDDGYLRYRVDRSRVVARNGHFFVMWLIGATGLLGYIALIFLRNQVRSITRLAAAADAFGRGEDVSDFKPSGAREVRQAGHAFIAMRARIKRFLEQRTEMLAGVSHDLKTPLTRLKLHLALDPDMPGADKMKSDLGEMERLLEDYLTFARGEAEDLREKVDLEELADELGQNAARLGRTLKAEVEPGLSLIAQKSQLSRAVSNLVTNGFKFADEVHFTAARKGETIEIAVDDDGPGIPEEERDAAVKAFSRLDIARNSNISGSGLGLAIVRDIARAHGGALRLESSDLGGLRAVIALPAPTKS